MTRQNLEDAGAQMPGTVSLSRLLRGGTLAALALSISGALAGCALVGDGAQSGRSGEPGESSAASTHAGAGEIPSSGAEQAMSTPAEKIMSGEYEVGPDGKLLNPNKDLTPPQVPELAKEHSKEGAEALASYYVELLPYMWMSRDTTPLSRIAHSDCEFCREFIQDLDTKTQNGAWVKDVSYQINKIGPTFEIPDHPGYWNVDVSLSRSLITGYNGDSLFSINETEENAHIQLQYERGQWRLWGVKRF